MWEEDYLPITGKENIDYLWCKSKYPTEPNDLKNFPKKILKNQILLVTVIIALVLICR